MRRLLKDPDFFQKQLKKRADANDLRAAVRSIANTMNQQKWPIESVGQLSDLTKQWSQVEVKPRIVRDVLTVDMGMRFRKINVTPLHLNSEKNIILRQ